MASKRDELDSFAMIKTIDYQKFRLKERKKIRDETKQLGEELVGFIFKDQRGETGYDETIEKHFIPAIINTAADPIKNDDLISSAQNIVYSKSFRVEHPRYRQLLQLDFQANVLRAVGAHAQVETAMSNESEMNISKKTRIHTFISNLKKALGQGSDDEFWTKEG